MNRLAALSSALLLAVATAPAATLPASEDTSSSRGKLTLATNKATTLPVDGTRHAFVFFNLAELPAGTQIRYARLRLYFPTVIRAGAGITAHQVTGAWDETVASAEPAFNGTPLATFAPATLGTKRFVSVDVTPTVRGWIATPASNEGFAFAVVPAASAKLTATVLIGAKEGSGSGYPAELEVEIADDAIPAGGIGTNALADGSVTGAKVATGLDTAKLGAGTVSTTEFAYLDGTTSAIQGQIDGKLALAGGTMTGALSLPANGLSVGTDQLAVSGGKVGIGIATPETPLHVVPTLAGRGVTIGVSAVTGGYTSLNFDISATSGGHGRIQAIKAGGSAFGDIVLSGDGGNVGVGRVPVANRLEVEGEASKTTATAWLANSDRRIKTDIRSIAGALETLDRVRPVAFHYTAEYRKAHPGIADHEYLNVIAQEFAEVFPEAVKGSGERLADGSEILQVDTYPATITAIAAIKELHAELKTLREENAALARRVCMLEAREQRTAGQ